MSVGSMELPLPASEQRCARRAPREGKPAVAQPEPLPLSRRAHPGSYHEFTPLRGHPSPRQFMPNPVPPNPALPRCRPSSSAPGTSLATVSVADPARLGARSFRYWELQSFTCGSWVQTASQSPRPFLCQAPTVRRGESAHPGTTKLGAPRFLIQSIPPNQFGGRGPCPFLQRPPSA